MREREVDSAAAPGLAQVAPRVDRRSRLAREWRTVPNLLSISRIFLIYGACTCFLVGTVPVGLVLGVLAGISDYLDGWVARKTGQVTELGAILDRLCDLIFESTWLLVATLLRLVSPVFIFLYLFRELIVLSARLWCGEHGVELKSSLVGKLKSNFFGYAAFCVYLNFAEVVPVPWLTRVISVLAITGLVGGLMLSYGSAYIYLRTFARAYNEDRSAK
jgi:CDP-diacylglycerol--glycerol-3-phosphate 3-phosphatidyltransferase